MESTDSLEDMSIRDLVRLKDVLLEQSKNREDKQKYMITIKKLHKVMKAIEVLVYTKEFW